MYLSDVYMVVGVVWFLLCRIYIRTYVHASAYVHTYTYVHMCVCIRMYYMHVFVVGAPHTDRQSYILYKICGHTVCTQDVHMVDRLGVIMARSCYNVYIYTYVHIYSVSCTYTYKTV